MDASGMELDARTLAPAEAEAEAEARCERLQPGEALVYVDGREPSWLLARLQRKMAHDFDWSPLESGPRRWRVRIDRRGAGAPPGRSVLEYLAWDHDRLDTLLEALRKRAALGDVDGAQASFAEFQHGLLRHIDMEEDVLFPLFDQRSGMAGAGPTEVMRAEHREIREVLARFPAALRAGSVPVLESEVAALLAVLSDHNLKEEEVVYPMTDHLLEDAEKDDLVHRLQRVAGGRA